MLDLAYPAGRRLSRGEQSSASLRDGAGASRGRTRHHRAHKGNADQTAAEIRKETGAKVTPIAGDISTEAAGGARRLSQP